MTGFVDSLPFKPSFELADRDLESLLGNFESEGDRLGMLPNDSFELWLRLDLGEVPCSGFPFVKRGISECLLLGLGEEVVLVLLGIPLGGSSE